MVNIYSTVDRTCVEQRETGGLWVVVRQGGKESDKDDTEYITELMHEAPTPATALSRTITQRIVNKRIQFRIYI